MSQYINFFIRCNDDFCPIATYSRSTNVYRDFSDRLNVPYEKITPLSKDDLKGVIEEADLKIKAYKKQVEKLEKEISDVSNMNNSIDEKTGMIENIYECIEENNLEIKWEENVQSFCSFLDDIIDEVIYDNNTSKFNASKYVYVGIEIGEPTIDDIVKE